MRIRKHAAKIFRLPAISSSDPYAATAAASAVARELETLVCQLNRSPWDVMLFTPPGSPSQSQLLQEEEELEGSNGFVISGNGIGGREEETGVVITSTAIERTVLRNGVKGEEMVEEKRERMVETVKRKGIKKVRKMGGRNLTSSRVKEQVQEEEEVKEKDDEEEEVKEKDEEEEQLPTAAAVVTCKKSDGKGWQCKREAQHPHSLCEYHLAQIRSYCNSGATSASSNHVHHYQQQPLSRRNTSTGGGGGEAKQEPSGNSCHDNKKNCSSSKKKKKKKKKRYINTTTTSTKKQQPASDFYYYYSGFGPWRGKTRGGNGNVGDQKGTVIEAGDDDVDRVAAALMVHDQASDDLDDDMFEDDDEDDDVGEDSDDDGVFLRNRRGRKPIKARSLKSLL